MVIEKTTGTNLFESNLTNHFKNQGSSHFFFDLSAHSIMYTMNYILKEKNESIKMLIKVSF